MNRLDTAFNFHESALRLRAQRQELLAANVANADTPNYKARDFNFAAALKNAMASTAEQDAMGTSRTSAEPDILYRGLIQGSVDGNSVDVDVERNQFTDNAIRYEASLNFISGDIKALLSVIQNNG
jgi:flagellar basal-body rod protein FlgB